MKFSAKNSVHSKSIIQKNLLERFFGGSKNIVFKTVLLVFGLVSMLGSTHALFNGTIGLDLGFNTGSPIEFNDYIRAFAEQDDGKILVGGAFTIYKGVSANRIIRLNADGTRDTTFDVGIGFNNIVYAINVQSDGKILVGGIFTTYQGVSANRIIRLNADGSRDTTFDIGVGFNDYIYALAVQTGGKIIAGGRFATYQGVAANNIIRLNTDGSRDDTFDIGGGFNDYIYPHAIKIQDDGKIVIGGLFTTYSGETVNRIVRLNTDGTRDSTFNMGVGFNNAVYTLAIQDDGKILIGGNFSTYQGVSANRIIRVNADGTRDVSFLGGGANTTVYSIALQTGGKIIVGGAFVVYNSVAAKYIVGLNADGTRDETFDIGVGLETTAYIAYVQSDGKILIGGAFTQYNNLAANKILRVNTDGSKDMSFTVGNGFNGYIITQVIQPDGKIIVGGNFTTYSGLATNYIVRLNTDGTRDHTFNIGGGFNDTVSSIALQSDGKIIVGGAFTTYSGVAALRIIRLNTDGTRDATFSAGGGNSTVYTVAIQTGDKIIVGGNFTTYSGVATKYIVGLNADGTRDTGFTVGAGFNGYVYTLAIQNDGKILAGGNAFTTYQGVAARRIVRLNTDGSRDTSFDVGGGFNALVTNFALQSDGKVLVGGSFTTYSGATAKYIARLHSNGLLDTGFSVGSSFNTTVQSLAIQDNGKILVGGSFTSYSGVAVNYITRLNADGTKDPTFSIGAGFNALVYTIDIQNNGKITAGGTFNSFDGELVGYFTSLYEIQPPTLISPSMNITREVPYGDLSWTPSASTGIFVYKYQIARNYSFTDIFSTGTTSATGISLTGLMDGSYYRRILTYDTVGNRGIWSSIGMFNVDTSAPVLTWTGATPADNAWTEKNSFLAQIDITETLFREFKWIWEGIQYSLYDSGLIFMMNFDKVDILGETDGYIQDISQYTNNGSGYGGITWTGEGKWNGAYQFDGTDDHIEIDWVYTGGYAYTMGGWLKYTESKSTPGFLTFTDSDGNRRDVYLYNDTALRIFTYNGTARYYTTSAFPALNDGEWHHIMAVYDGTNAPWVFIDGIKYTTNTPTSTSTQTKNKIKIGLINNGSTLPAYHFNGMIDEVRIYNRALSQEEILLLYNSNLNKYDTNKRNFSIKQYNEIEGSYVYTGLVTDNIRTTEISKNIARGDVYAPILTWIGATPEDNAWIENNSFTAQIDITEGFLKKFSRYWNGEEYILYDSGLLLMYNFDNIEDLGENKIYIKDISSSNNNGSGYGGITRTGEGKWNGAYQFPGGTTGGVCLGTKTMLEGATVSTFTTRINPTNIPTRNSANDIITKYGSYYMALSTTGGSAKLLFTYYNSGGSYTRRRSTATIPTNTWTHVAVVRNGTAIQFYINGQPDASYTTDPDGYRTYNSTLTIGAVRNGIYPAGSFSVNRAYSGLIDEVRIYNRALTSGEVAVLYNSNLNKYDSNKWNFTILQTGIMPGNMYSYTGTVSDSLSMVSTGRSIQQDNIGPTFTFADNSGPECSAGILTIADAVDTGVGLHDTSPYSFNGIAWNTTADIVITAQQPGSQTRTGRARDQLENFATHTATYTFTDVAPTANDFTGSASVGNTAKSADRKTLSSATEGACGADDIIYDSIHSQGTKGMCSVVGDTITYTPDADQVGNDSCTLRIKDNENTTKDIIVSRGAIDTSRPSTPLLLSPASGTSLTTGTVDLLRSGSTDLGAGLSGYLWQLSTGSNFATLISGGFTTTTGVTILGLNTATYYRRVYAVDLVGNTGDRSSSRNFTIAPAISFAIESPGSLALGTISVPETTQVIEKVFTGSEDYFVLSDYIGDDQGYYTTLSMSSMTNGNGASLSNQNIAIKSASSIVTLAGSENPNVTSAIGGSYITFGNNVLTFIKRDPGSNGGLIGTYGISPALKVTIPELQNSGNYSGTLIYTIYPN